MAELMDRDDEIDRMANDIAECVNRWWDQAQGKSLAAYLREAMSGGSLDHLAIYWDPRGRVLVPIHPVELSFMRRFDPDRDRSASRRELVEVIEHWQEELTDALGPDPVPVETQPWVCRVQPRYEHIDAPCTGDHPQPPLGTSLTRHGLKNRDVPKPEPVLDSKCQTCGKRVSRENAESSRWWHVGYTDEEIGHGALPAW